MFRQALRRLLIHRVRRERPRLKEVGGRERPRLKEVGGRERPRPKEMGGRERRRLKEVGGATNCDFVCVYIWNVSISQHQPFAYVCYIIKLRLQFFIAAHLSTYEL